MAATRNGGKAEIGDKFRLRYFIICDEARREATRKLLLIGVYTDTILISAPTTELPRLAFIFCFTRLTDELPETGMFRLEGPDGVVLPETTFPIKQEVTEFRASNMLIYASGVPLTVGDYRAVFTVNGATEFIGEFSVQLEPGLQREIESGATLDSHS